MLILLPLSALAQINSDGKTHAHETVQVAGRRPQIVAHRGLLRHAPENTLAAFTACIDLRLGFELDVRRSQDGRLVCVHDEDVQRTTDGKGKVANLTLAQLRKLDAGRWFDPAFAGERVPTLEEVFTLLRDRKASKILVALDLKVEGIETDVVRLAEKYGVLEQTVCIGLAIADPVVRRKLRAAQAKTPVAVLAQQAEDLPKALGAADADWIYIRFVPTPEQVAHIHAARKRVFLVGSAVSGLEPANWARAREAGVDAILTDFPLDCRRSWREGKSP
jgi:glycerophosphoryl diester phosphodiesterase